MFLHGFLQGEAGPEGPPGSSVPGRQGQPGVRGQKVNCQ